MWVLAERCIRGNLSWDEQRELLWGVAEAWRAKEGSSDWHPSFSCFASSRCLSIQPTQPAVSGGRVDVCLSVCVFICPGLRYAALIKPTAKRETCQAANSNDPEYAYGCFGENKWAENGIHKHSWYRERRGGERLKSSSAAARQTPPSHVECFIDYSFLSACMYIWAVRYDNTCQASQSCCRQEYWVGCCCCRAQSGSLVPQTIHRIHVPEAGTSVYGQDACRTVPITN